MLINDIQQEQLRSQVYMLEINDHVYNILSYSQNNHDNHDKLVHYNNLIQQVNDTLRKLSEMLDKELS